VTAPRRAALLGLLQRRGPMTAGELAVAVGLHVNTAREHLRVLVEEGYAERDRGTPDGRGRPRMRYRAVPEPVAPAAVPAPERSGGVRDALVRALLDGYGVAGGDPAETARAHGRRAAAELPAPPGGPRDQLGALTAHLAGLGFDPVVTPGADAVVLRACPLLDLARERPDVVCALHLGLAQGVLARAAGPLRATAVRPFTSPGRCLLHLGGARAADAPAGRG
jgi:predicted ArsR family transcriptional regulator